MQPTRISQGVEIKSKASIMSIILHVMCTITGGDRADFGACFMGDVKAATVGA